MFAQNTVGISEALESEVVLLNFVFWGVGSCLQWVCNKYEVKTVLCSQDGIPGYKRNLHIKGKEINPSSGSQVKGDSELAGPLDFVQSPCRVQPALCEPMDCSMPGLPASHHLPVCPSSHPLHKWCPISSSDALFPEPFPASGTFPVSQLFTPDQNTGASASRP